MGSLRTKATVGFLVMVAYVVGVVVLISQQRATMLREGQSLAAVHAVEESLTKVNTSVAHAMLHLNEAYFGRDVDASIETVLLDVEAIQAGLRNLVGAYAGANALVERLGRDVEELREVRERSALVPLRDTTHALVAELDHLGREVAARKQSVNAAYRSAFDAIALIGLAAGVAGVLAFGTMVTVFVGRASRDLLALKRRATEILDGYRAAPLPVARNDEIGELIDAVNRMQSGLRERERQLEVSRQQRFHQEKMAAVGSLAAAIAHEINNPIAAIQGVAESLEAECDARSGGDGGAATLEATARRSRLIIEQTHRIATITRQLSDATAPQAAEPALLDLNALVRNVCSFVSYDPRFRGIAMPQALDASLPAIEAVPDHLTQVLMNLLINAADALAERPAGDRAIRVSTWSDGAGVWLQVHDTGSGMDAATMRRAFDEFFTTKPHGRGTGIGLYMCRDLIARGGGGIEIDSTPGVGTTVLVRLPRRRAVQSPP